MRQNKAGKRAKPEAEHMQAADPLEGSSFVADLKRVLLTAAEGKQKRTKAKADQGSIYLGSQRDLVLEQSYGVSRIRGTLLGDPYGKDYRIWGVFIGVPYLEKLPYRFKG